MVSDPFALKRNVARSLNSQMVFEYIQERFRMAYKYFACPQRRVPGGSQRNKKAGGQGAKLEGAVSMDKEEDGKADKSEQVQRGHTRPKQGEEPESDDEDGPDKANMTPSERNRSSYSPNGLLDSDEEGEEQQEEEQNSGPSEDLHYVFDKMIFTGGKVTSLH